MPVPAAEVSNASDGSAMIVYTVSFPAITSPPLSMSVTMVTRAERRKGTRLRSSAHAPPPRGWFEIINEIRSELGLELFMLARAVWLRAWTPTVVRKKLFRPKTARHIGDRRIDALKAAPVDLRPDLQALMRLSGRRPASDEEAAEACENISAWAQTTGFPKTALHFAEAAAAIAPRSPHFAFIAGRANRILGDPRVDAWRAEAFYSRATRYGSHQLNWTIYIRAHLGHARLLAERGSARAAVKHYKSAASACIDQGHDWLAAQTLHDICGLYFEQGDLANARRYGVEALNVYPRHNERFPIAVHDALFLFLVDNYYREVYPHLQLLFHLPLPPHEQVMVAGSLARAAGHLQDRSVFADCESRILHLSPHYDSHAAAAHINLAFGAWACGDLSLARSYAKAGLAIAKRRRERHVVEVGSELAKSLQLRKAPPSQVQSVDNDSAIQLAMLAEIVTTQLINWHGDTWTKKEEQAGPATLGPV